METVIQEEEAREDNDDEDDLDDSDNKPFAHNVKISHFSYLTSKDEEAFQNSIDYL